MSYNKSKGERESGSLPIQMGDGGRGEEKVSENAT
jgi:hypothetical protein